MSGLRDIFASPPASILGGPQRQAGPGVETASPYFVPGGIPSWPARALTGTLQTAAQMAMPKDLTDVALMLTPGGVVGKTGRIGLGALATALIASDPKPTQKEGIP